MINMSNYYINNLILYNMLLHLSAAN